MARNPWPAQFLSGDRPHIESYTLKSGSTFLKGALVYLDSNEEIDECGADPGAAGVLGTAEEPAADVIETGKMRVALANDSTLFAMYCSSTPTEDNLDQNYGVVKSGSTWLVDLTETTADVVRPIRLVEQGSDTYVLVRFVAAVRQMG